ncbi:di-heme-cytochrome C peroxidase [Bosea sp. 685]|uniref:di-heme-cytochrome C peroxidase n=1 Tax=Bosea sp. 685 TaxID=3080057 RepID=UPI002892ADFD|nr:di-heme-cytochrome C peroxidase [Bosea sp. 685]WNJ88851.1 di-heme-cytochrome C peroxidase [Bosea sp. 685]
MSKRASWVKVVRRGFLGLAALIGLALIAAMQFPDALKQAFPGTPIDLALRPTLPVRAPIKQAQWLDQNWSQADRHWFHHASQGTATIPVPYAWFVALEQPEFSYLGTPGLLTEPGYLERFGFIPSPRSLDTGLETLQRYGYFPSTEATMTVATAVPRTGADNLDGLPVGFARMPGRQDPTRGSPMPDQLGFTCAACHTGHLTYKGTSLRFDGGPAMIDLGKLEQAIGLSIYYAWWVPFRFQRFATRLLGQDPAPEALAKLKTDMTEVMEGLNLRLGNREIIKARKDKNGDPERDTIEGIGRLDALNRIGNQVFFENLRISDKSSDAHAQSKVPDTNLAALHAPVSFPPIWGTPWFSWAQYDASILQPLVRNAGEALGVSAKVNMVSATDPATFFRSSVILQNLYWFEELLKGDHPFSGDTKGFKGLAAPHWPSQYFADDPKWRINDERVGRGRALYKQFCVECHLGPARDPTFDRTYPEASLWTSQAWKHKESPADTVLSVVQKPAAAMGTDREQSNVLQTRKVEIPDVLKMDPAKELGENWGCTDVPGKVDGKELFAPALMAVVDRVVARWFEDNQSSAPFKGDIIGTRPNCPNKNGPVYRARPLDGVWATAPYLHNGSVPSLWWMLLPASARPTRFCLGAQDFDPGHVGFPPLAGQAECKKGEFTFDTAHIGNSNSGHSFEGDGQHLPNGVIGRALSEPERLDLIEYLKTL